MESLGSDRAHFFNAVIITELTTNKAPNNENPVGLSPKNNHCQMKAKTMSAQRAIATGPACSICNEIVNKIWPRKLNNANTTIKYLSEPQAGQQMAPMNQQTIKV